MKLLLPPTLALMVAVLCSGGSPVPWKPAAKAPPQKVAGDYVEVRTASVFTGACHYNGELVTTGRDAILAWNFTGGAWQGVDLTGVRAMAAVTCDANLGQEQAARKTELVVDSTASEAQASAVASVLREKCGNQLGTIVSTRRAPVTFEQSGRDYWVKSDGYGSMSVTPMPDGECCKQPHLVWYTPLSPVEHRKVGFTRSAAYTAGTLGDRWEREGENSAFYGSFAF
jgi:hypothetical protein